MNIKSITKKPVLIILGIVIILNIIDLITAYRVLPGEANPIYLLTGSYLVLVLLKLFIIGVIIFAYLACYKTPNKKPNASSLFIYTTYMLLFMCALAFGIYTNVGATDVQIQTVEQVKSEMTPDEIRETNADSTILYFRIMFVLMIYPAIISIAAFYIWRRTFINGGGALI